MIEKETIDLDNRTFAEMAKEYHEMRMRTDPGYFVDHMDRITPGGCYLCYNHVPFEVEERFKFIDIINKQIGDIEIDIEIN